MNLSKPQRTCIVCKHKDDKSHFIKVLKNKNNELYIAKTNHEEGRGAYICKSNDCINKAIKTKALNRAFKTNVPDNIYEELSHELQ